MQFEALVLKHFGKVPQDFSEFKKMSAYALWIEEKESERLFKLFEQA